MDIVNQIGLVTPGALSSPITAAKPVPPGKQTGTGNFTELLSPKDTILGEDAKAGLKANEVNRKLESMLLSQFIGEFIKHDAEAVFGQGVQGDFYKSLFADAIADQMSQQSILGFTKVT